MFEPEEDVEPGRERIKRSKDTVTEISMEELKERNTNFLKLMRCAVCSIFLLFFNWLHATKKKNMMMTNNNVETVMHELHGFER